MKTVHFKEQSGAHPQCFPVTYTFHCHGCEDAQNKTQDETHPSEDVKHQLDLKRYRVHQGEYDGES